MIFGIEWTVHVSWLQGVIYPFHGGCSPPPL